MILIFGLEIWFNEIWNKVIVYFLFLLKYFFDNILVRLSYEEKRKLIVRIRIFYKDFL